MHFCLVKNFNYDIDKAICNALFNYQNIESQRKLKSIIESKEYLGRIVHEKTFRYRVKKMLGAGYIFKEEQNEKDWKRGKKLPLCLSPEIRDQIKLRNMIIRYDYDNRLHSSYSKFKKQRKREEERIETELKRGAIYYIIMRVMSIETPYNYYKPPGFSITDIINGRLDGHAFWYLNLDKRRVLIQECIKNLRKENIVKSLVLADNDEPRYELTDPIWKNFVIDCEELLENSIMHRLHLVWYSRRPRPEERSYYELCWGEKETDVHMNWIYNYDDEEKHKKRLVKTQHRSDDGKDEKVMHLLKSLDNAITKYVEVLDKKYYNLLKMHPYLYNEIFETVYPIFLQNEVKRTVSNPKNRGKKYPQFRQVHIKETLDPNVGVEKITFR